MTDLQQAFTEEMKKEECTILCNEPLKNHCTFHIGGNAEILFVPKKEKALIKALKFADENNVPFHILGNGSNVLIPDTGLIGITIKLSNALTDIIYLGDGYIGCAAGVSVAKLCLFALEHSLTGLEFAYGIPGSVGGAIYMNAGAYGGEMKDVLYSAKSVDRKGKKIEEEKISDLEYSYRNTSFMKNGRIILAGYFKLKEGNKTEISAKMTELMNKRKASQPLDCPSAGSTFKRPETGYAAAHIDQCGLKGLTVGGAQVSTKHAGFVINTGDATYDDVINIIKKIKDEVFRQHGVELQPEVEILKD